MKNAYMRLLLVGFNYFRKLRKLKLESPGEKYSQVIANITDTAGLCAR
jgi:hypothetical protein